MRQLFGGNLASGEVGNIDQHKHFGDVSGSGSPDAVVTSDYFQPSFRFGAERQAFQTLVPRYGLRQPLKHGLGHRAGVDILLAQRRGVNLPEFQSVAEFQNSLGLDYG